MPWHIESDNPDCSGFAVVKDDGGDVEGCHETREQAARQMAALYANEDGRTMTTPIPLHRMTHMDLEVRSDGRTIFGTVMPFDTETRVNDGYGDYTEVFRMGAFAKTIRERGDRIKLLVNHDKYGRLPIGVSSRFQETRAGLQGEFRVSKTSAGDEALTLVNDRAVDSFSVGFIPVIPGPREAIPRSGLVERTEVKIVETSLVGFPAYEDARIAGVRNDLNVIWGLLSPAEQEAARHLDLHALILRAAQEHAADTPDEAAPEGTSEEAAERAAETDEPTPDADEVTSDGHSSSYQPTQRPTKTPERLREELEQVAARVAAAVAKGAMR